MYKIFIRKITEEFRNIIICNRKTIPKTPKDFIKKTR